MNPPAGGLFFDGPRRGKRRAGMGRDVCFGSKADMAAHFPDVRFTPKSGHCIAPQRMSALCQKQTFAPLFDHLVREREEEWRNLNALSFGGPNVEIEQELRWSHDRQVGGFAPLRMRPV